MTVPSTRKWHLQQLATDKLIDITLPGDCMVGRNGDARVSLKSNKASRTHAMFVVNIEGNLLVQDLKSVNGTFVNGRQIAVYILHPVYPEDIVSFGIAQIDSAADFRDRQCFFKVMLVEEPSSQDSTIEVPMADSTTESRESSISDPINVHSTKNSTDEAMPDSVMLISDSGEHNECFDVIEISSNTSDQADPSPEFKAQSASSVTGNEFYAKTTRITRQTKKTFKEIDKPSLESSKEIEVSVPPNISKKRRTVEVIDRGRKNTYLESAETSARNSGIKSVDLTISEGENKEESNGGKSEVNPKKSDKKKNTAPRDTFHRTGKIVDCIVKVPPIKETIAPISNTKKILNSSDILGTGKSTDNEVNPTENEGLNNEQNEDLAVADINFSTHQDNSVIIDITNDDDDDKYFSCSQIFQMSQIVKIEAPDDTYQKIKSELAEMDFYNDEHVVNPVPIDLENDYSNSGFENTQDICELLQDGIDVDNNNAAPDLSVPNSNDHLLNVSNLSADCKQNESNISRRRESTSKNRHSTEKEKSPKIQLIDPPAIVKPTKKLKDSSKKKINNTNKTDKGSSHKRKSSLDAPIDKKKLKSNTNSHINPLKFNSKDIALEFKKRRSSSIDLDKADKNNIKEERRKKLKELASPTSKFEDNEENNHTNVSEVPKEPETKAKRVRIARNSSSLDAKKNISNKTTAASNAYGTLKLVDLPQSTPNRNLRRAKSSDDLRARKPNNVIAIQNRPATRRSTNLDSRNMQIVSNFRMEVISTTRADPRMVALVSNQHYSRAAYPGPIQSHDRRLMWSNGPLARKPTARRLANVDDITKKIVHWLPTWLGEQVYSDGCPPVNNPPATKIPLNFPNFSRYYDTFSKLVLLENWQYLFKGFQEAPEQTRKVKVEHVRVVNDLMTLDCICYISRQELKNGLFYKPEDVILFECIANDKRNSYISLNFGIIQSCRRSLIPNNGLISIKGDLCPGNPHMRLEFTVMTRYDPDREINTRRTPIIKLLANVRAHLMLIRAIKGLEESPLCSMILSPKMANYKFAVTHPDIIHPCDLSYQQKAVVLEAASLCTGKKHGIYCVKGPPGTGKSTVVVNLIFQILFSHRCGMNPSGKTPMILLAAPSNTAVDSLISKLVAIKYSLPFDLRHQIKLVRIGPESSINKEVMGYSLPKLAENHVPIKNMDLPDIKAARDRNENLIEFSKTYFGEQYIQEIKCCENLIIAKSNIICTTLNSCINGRLIDAVNKGLIEFTCCIIDEATQCHEVEALLPTILGIDKLVLVGDPRQLNATIMSRDALKLGFGESLFTRLANNFKNDPRSPIKMLTDQYRMHPDICEFPNKQFYEGKLRSFPNPVNKLPDEIRPYLVFSCQKLTPSMDYTNKDEIHLIKVLLSTIFSMVNRKHKYTVGIITPYNAQKDLICTSIADLTAENENCKITTNTVDSFQGSEFDIVIISCVRDSSNSFLQNENRLNVALTRAKQALYIIGNYTLFKECRPLYDLREDAKKRKVILDIKQNPKSMSSFSKYLIRN